MELAVEQEFDCAGLAIFTTPQVAKLMGVAPRTVQQWFASGKLRGYQTPGGHGRVPREHLEAFLRDIGRHDLLAALNTAPPESREDVKAAARRLVAGQYHLGSPTIDALRDMATVLSAVLPKEPEPKEANFVRGDFIQVYATDKDLELARKWKSLWDHIERLSVPSHSAVGPAPVPVTATQWSLAPLKGPTLNG